MSIIWTLYIYVSKDVRILGYSLSQKGPANKRFWEIKG
jgi:hypothetical protein